MQAASTGIASLCAGNPAAVKVKNLPQQVAVPIVGRGRFHLWAIPAGMQLECGREPRLLLRIEIVSNMGPKVGIRIGSFVHRMLGLAQGSGEGVAVQNGSLRIDGSQGGLIPSDGDVNQVVHALELLAEGVARAKAIEPPTPSGCGHRNHAPHGGEAFIDMIMPGKDKLDPILLGQGQDGLADIEDVRDLVAVVIVGQVGARGHDGVMQVEDFPGAIACPEGLFEPGQLGFSGTATDVILVKEGHAEGEEGCWALFKLIVRLRGGVVSRMFLSRACIDGQVVELGEHGLALIPVVVADRWIDGACLLPLMVEAVESQID